MLFSFSKYILSVVSFVLLTMSFVFSVTTPVFAQGAVENDVFGVADLADEEEGLVLGSGDIRQVVAQIINVFLGLLGIVAVGIIIYGGYLYMTSNGNEDQISQAKKIIINGVIGLVIILSSFTIAQFFIRNFSNATGVRTGINGEGNGNGGGGGNDVRCEGANPPLFCIPDEQLQCEDIHFFVQSITPSTPGPGVDPTDMNNIVVRAVFTKPVANTFNAASIFTVTNEQGNIVPVEITMSSDRYIAQATVSKGESCAAGVTCFDPGLYTVTVNKDLRSQQTNDQEAMPLEIDLGGDCGRYPNVATFRVNTTNVIDTQAPQISELKVNGKDGNDVVVSRNAAHTITARIQDQNSNGESAGVAYARLRVYEEGEQAATGKVVYEGPVVVEGSSQPFAFSYDYFIPRCVGCSPDKYIIELTAYDIDHNTTVALSSIIVVGPQCDALGAPLEGASRPQECLQQQHTCTQDWQCPSQKCVENRCVAFPVILDVDPWDGAQGNLITLVGRYFGETAGTVEFGIDKNNDGVFTNDDVWVPAELTQCGTSDVWHDDWVVVEVPSDQQLPQDTLTAIRITRADDKTFQDTTVDAHGNKPGPRAGLWQKNATNRPGLCSVVAGSTDQDIQKYVTAGLPNASVIALGIGFGDTQTNQSELLFSGVAAPISQWSVNRVFGQVPSAARVGKLGVHVRVKDVRSNAVPFTVLREGEDVLPIIDSVDPVSATPGSFITLSGQRFGSDVGSVFMADSPELALTCAQTDDNTRPNTCVELLTTLPNCDASASWNDQQVIVGIPESASPRAQYFIVLKKRNGLLTDGNTTLAVVEGKPAPSLCQLVPNRGPAPRADELTVFGNNLLADEGIPSVYFWWKQARVDAIDTWLSESNADRLSGGALLGSTRQDKKLSFYLPVSTQDGVSSMNSGPIRVSVDGVLSNSVYYAVERCTDPGAVPPDAGYRCCTEGIGQGQWVPENRSCPGETMSAGYVWRFTTGKIPEKLRVIEECREQNGVPRVDDPIPSPTPWFGAAQGQGWADGDRACVNADIVIRFSLALDETTVTPSTARIYTCTGDDTPTCNNPVDVSAAFDRIVELNGDQGVLKLRPLPNQQNERTLSPNTWYRVALTSDIKSQKDVVILGNHVTRHEPLLSTRPLETDNIAYHFHFKTSAGVCQLDGAGIQPPQYIARDLGVIQDSRFPYDIGPDSIERPQHPLYYYLWGSGDQACRVINVDGLGWDWQVTNENNHTVVDQRATTKIVPSEQYTDSRATVMAIENTFPEGVDIVARTEVQTIPIETQSNLIVHLGNPQVVYSEPNCLASCTNASIRAVFNRRMDVETYAAGVRVFQCNDANCSSLTLVPSEQYDISRSSDLELVIDWKRGYQLEPNTYYKVSLNGSNGEYIDTDVIRSLGRILPPLPGVALAPFEWRFRTKDDGQACTVSRVDVLPLSWIARIIQEKTLFTAVPYSSPNECSTRGQRLSAFHYGWDWASDDESVATVTSFDTSNSSLPSYCSSFCTLLGSDIDRASLSTARLCGNGRVDDGEDCDIGLSQEIVPITCSLRCLRPGNTLSGVQSGQCGNGSIDNPITGVQAGEQCDPGNTNGVPKTDDPYCSATCQLKGSASLVTQDQVQASVCGDGVVSRGESCDTGVLGGFGCGSSCLHTGTRTAQAWCDLPNNRFINTTECQTAASVCGNGVIEQGESCEIGLDGATAVTCSSRCLLQRVCGTPLAECTLGEEGCSDECTFAGSSLLYTKPSLCGDGEIGIGEFSGTYGQANTTYACEVATSQEGDPIAGDAPSQITTAIGLSLAVDEFGYQKTTISASVHDSLAQFGDVITGKADYSLQCGNVEFATPIVQPNLDIVFNDCQLLDSSEANDIGVASNSCCYPRMKRVASYPLDGAGIANQSESICRNTYLSVSFDGQVDEASLENNLIIARGHQAANYDCSLDGAGSVSLTDAVQYTLASLDTQRVIDAENGLVPWLWWHIKRLFSTVFFSSVTASEFTVSDIKTWCRVPMDLSYAVHHDYTVDGNISTSTVSVFLKELLAPQSVYALFLRGGNTGIQDIRGVGIQNVDHADALSDSIVFQTGTDICKIKNISVSPERYTFTAPYTSTTFQALVESTNNQLIVPIDNQYDWEWSWGPRVHSVFSIPAEGDVPTEPIISIAAKNVEGEVDALALARITSDIDTNPNTSHIGKTFAGSTHLQAAFCERPWPSAEQDQFPFIDSSFNFTFHYCADAGVSGIDDDYPYFSVFSFTEDTRQEEVVIKRCSLRTEQFCSLDADCAPAGGICETTNERRTIAEGILPQETLKRYLLLSDDEQDVIGFQIFRNKERLSPSAWYGSQEFAGGQFTNAADFRSVVIAGYDAITDGNNYYIHALNRVDQPLEACGNTGVCSNIYHISINPNATKASRAVFDQILDTLTFNTNFTDYQYCGLPNQDTPDYDGTSVACTNDFACSSLDAAVDCKADRTEFLSDFRVTLPHIALMQTAVDTVFSQTNNYPSLDAGTFLPNYTNSRWPSWGQTFAEQLGRPLPRGDVNNWSACGVCVNRANAFCTQDEDCGAGGSCRLLDSQTCWDAAASTYICSEHADIYEYSYDRDDRSYTIHADLDYFDTTDPVVSEFISLSHFTTDRFCTPQAVLSPLGERCGDGIVNVAAGEQCDSLDIVSVGTRGYVGEQRGQCNFVFSNASCLVDLDCKGSVFEYDTGFYTVDRPGSHGVCSWQGEGLIYGQQRSKQLQIFSCSDDRTCQKPSTYLDAGANAISALLSGAINNYAVTENSVNNGNFVCERIDRLEQYVQPTTGRYVQCVGAIPDGGVGQCPRGSVASVGCTDQCQFAYGSCESQFACGNGAVEGTERCDDGVLNGTYGHCNALCTAQFTAYCGNGVRDWTDTNGNAVRDPGETGAEFCETQDVLSVGYCEENPAQVCRTDEECGGSRCLATDTAQYHHNRSYSCSWDCQSFGGYCGDGVIQSSYEACDGGDGCSSTCTLLAPQTPENNGQLSDAPRCGDGIVQEQYPGGDDRVDEICDKGALNGVVCSAEYGQSCVYCSADCQEVLTVDPASFCGDNRLDNAVEACETFGNLVVIPDSLEQDGYAEKICEDLGTYQCNSTCTTLTDTCVACQPLREPQGAEPRLAIINPALTKSYPNGFPANSWPALTVVQLFRPDAAFRQLEWGVRYRGIPGYNTDVHGIDYEEPFTLTNFQDSELTVESNIQCNGQYYVAFNALGHCDKSLNQLCTSDAACGQQGPCRFGASYALSQEQRPNIPWYRAYPTSVQTDSQSPFFPYPVDSEPTVIEHEVVASPAVPEGVYRVVLRYGSDVRSMNARLGLSVYNLGFSDAKQVGYHTLSGQLDNDEDWSDDLQLFTSQNDYRTGYWWPTRLEETLHKRSVFVHFADGLEDTFTQAITIDTTDNLGRGLCVNGPTPGASCTTNSDCRGGVPVTGSCNFSLQEPFGQSPLRSFAVYVTSLNGPITQYDDMDIFVDVYTYKEGQDPTFSLLQPSVTYRIQGATKSTNPQARYWHVFNLAKIDTNRDGTGDSYVIESPIEAFPDVNDANGNGRTTDFLLTEHPQGSIETGFQDIKCNTPEERQICRR